MATELPVRIEFSLPDGWKPVPPDDVNASDAAFVALHPPATDGFTPNITIAGQTREDDTTLAEIAEESVRRLGRTVGTTRVRDRTEKGPADARSLTQVLDIVTDAVNAPRDLVQCQMYVAMQNVHDSTERVVLELVLSCTADQFAGEVGDFQEFVRSVRSKGTSAPDGANPSEPQVPQARHTRSSKDDPRRNDES